MMVEFTETNAFAAGYYLGEVYDFINWLSLVFLRLKETSLIEEKKTTLPI